MRGFSGSSAVLGSNVRHPTEDGPVAQLGARLNGIQEVTGSIPVRSTNSQSLIPNDGKPDLRLPVVLLGQGVS